MNAITVPVSDAMAERLDALASKLDLPTVRVVEQAIEDFVAREEWQLAEIEAGMADADRGDFATPEEMAAVLAKYIKPEV
ncbi:CopG family ribbon-helix-helix protein [Rhizobium sp.]